MRYFLALLVIARVAEGTSFTQAYSFVAGG